MANTHGETEAGVTAESETDGEGTDAIEAEAEAGTMNTAEEDDPDLEKTTSRNLWIQEITRSEDTEAVEEMEGVILRDLEIMIEVGMMIADVETAFNHDSEQAFHDGQRLPSTTANTTDGDMLRG